MRATIRNRRVKCPHCHQGFEVKRAYGEGAGYVEDWDRMPHHLSKIMLSLACMCSDTWWTKADLRHHLNNANLEMSANALNARISELVGLDVLRMKIGDYPNDKYHSTENPPCYEIQEKTIQRIVKNDLKLPARLSRFI